VVVRLVVGVDGELGLELQRCPRPQRQRRAVIGAVDPALIDGAALPAAATTCREAGRNHGDHPGGDRAPAVPTARANADHGLLSLVSSRTPRAFSRFRYAFRIGSPDG